MPESSRTRDEHNTDPLQEGLKTLMECFTSFLQARQLNEITFEDAVVAEGLRILSAQITKAAEADAYGRRELCNHWIEHGPEISNAVLENVMDRDSKTMTRDDLEMFLRSPEGPGIYHEFERFNVR